MFYLLPMQTLLAAALGAFIAMERCWPGVPAAMRVHAAASSIACLIGWTIAGAGLDEPADFMIVTAALGLVILFPARRLAQRWSAENSRTSSAPVELVPFGAAIWVGSACGLGDLRAVVFVVLLFCIHSLLRSRETADQDAGTVATSETAGASASAFAYSMPRHEKPAASADAPAAIPDAARNSEAEAQAAAEQLAALAQALRMTVRQAGPDVHAAPYNRERTRRDARVQTAPEKSPAAVIPFVRPVSRRERHSVSAPSAASAGSLHPRGRVLQRANYQPVA
ncbi:MAG: MgtC/SapB family protein [Beijerinckiaceae bacterium]